MYKKLVLLRYETVSFLLFLYSVVWHTLLGLLKLEKNISQGKTIAMHNGRFGRLFTTLYTYFFV